jgi:GNAT superfamily N-acetyltransferase
MWWRGDAKTYKENKGEGNRGKLKALVGRKQGPAPGLLAYSPDETGELRCAGWVAIAPRSDYPRFEKSSIVKPIDDTPVWCVSCLFVHKDFRRTGLSVALIDAAARYAFEHDAVCVEGYPTDTNKEQPPAFVFTGVAEAFARAGFVEVARHSANRPIMRRSR